MKTKRFVLTYAGAGFILPAGVGEPKDHVSVLDQSRCSLLVDDAPEHLDRGSLSPSSSISCYSGQGIFSHGKTTGGW